MYVAPVSSFKSNCAREFIPINLSLFVLFFEVLVKLRLYERKSREENIE